MAEQSLNRPVFILLEHFQLLLYIKIFLPLLEEAFISAMH